MSKVTPFLMFNGRLEEAVALYKSIFADAKIEYVNPQSASFELGGQQFFAFDGGDHFSFSDGISLFVACEDQAEVDYYWEKLTTNGGEEGYCGWLKDPFGLSWQIIPKVLHECLGGEDRDGAARAMSAMMEMSKIDAGAIKKAYDGV